MIRLQTGTSILLLKLIFWELLEVLIAQSCPTLCNPMDGSPPGSSVCGLFQARILEWESHSKGSSRSRDRTRVCHPAGRFFTIWATREAPFYYLGVCNYCLALASLLLSYSFIKLASKRQAVLVGTWLSVLSGLALPSVPFVSPHSSLSLLPAVFLSLWPLCLSPPPSPILASIQSVLCWLCPLSLTLFLPRSLSFLLQVCIFLSFSSLCSLSLPFPGSLCRYSGRLHSFALTSPGSRWACFLRLSGLPASSSSAGGRGELPRHLTRPLPKLHILLARKEREVEKTNRRHWSATVPSQPSTPEHLVWRRVESHPPDVWPEAGALVGEMGGDFTASLSRGGVGRGHGWGNGSRFKRKTKSTLSVCCGWGAGCYELRVWRERNRNPTCPLSPLAGFQSWLLLLVTACLWPTGFPFLAPNSLAVVWEPWFFSPRVTVIVTFRRCVAQRLAMHVSPFLPSSRKSYRTSQLPLLSHHLLPTAFFF